LSTPIFVPRSDATRVRSLRVTRVNTGRFTPMTIASVPPARFASITLPAAM
jgi:hypothetical protein